MAEQTADQRKALYAHQQHLVQQEGEVDLPVYMEQARKQLSLDERLGNHLFLTENTIWSLVVEMRAAGRLPELFRRLRKLIDKLEAEAAADENSLEHDCASVGEAAE